jgi:hypothetical protein
VEVGVCPREEVYRVECDLGLFIHLLDGIERHLLECPVPAGAFFTLMEKLDEHEGRPIFGHVDELNVHRSLDAVYDHLARLVNPSFLQIVEGPLKVRLASEASQNDGLAVVLDNKILLLTPEKVHLCHLLAADRERDVGLVSERMPSLSFQLEHACIAYP